MREIKALTALRGIAAMMVVLQHFSATAQEHAAFPIPSLVPHGYIAVDLFFVLSGFIMAYTYEADFQSHGWRAFPGFLLKRVARIVPLNTFAVFFVLICGAGTAALLGRNIIYNSNNLLFDILCNLLMLQGIGVGLNLNGPSWSISTEFAAYFVFPVLLAVVLHRQKAIAIAALAMCFVFLAAIAAGHPRLGLDTDSIQGGAVRCITEFVIGLGTYRMIGSPKARAFLAGDRCAVVVIAAVLLLLVARIDFLVVALFPPLIGALACNRGAVADWFARPVPYFLGVISFSIYLLHNPLRPIWLQIIRFLHPAPMSTPLALSVAFACSLSVIPLAWLAFVTVERPGRRIIRRNAASRLGLSRQPRPL